MVINMEADRNVDDVRRAIAEATGIEHSRLMLRATTTGCKLSPLWVLSSPAMEGITDVTVFVNLPPKTLYLRITFDANGSGDGELKFIFTVKLQVNEGEDGDVAIVWARRDNYCFPHDGSEFAAKVEQNGSRGHYYTSKETTHWTFKFNELHFSNSWSVEFVYAPESEPRWWPVVAYDGGYRLNVTRMSVDMIAPSDVVVVGSMTEL
jgi:hypothetical protein